MKSASGSRKILITAALPYANGYIHLGHLAGAYLPADIYARYQRLKGNEVLFLCGSDEHGVAIMVSAEQEKVAPGVVIDRYHTANAGAFRRFGMSFDVYSRTSLPLHHETTREFFLSFHRRGLLKTRSEQQLYCEFDKMFLADRYVEGTCPVCGSPGARGDQCENCGSWLNQTELISPVCKLCGRTPVVRETTHLYFPLGAYQERLEAYIRERDARDGWKENVLRYCGSWFKEGLTDRAVTRDLSWGVPVPVEGFEHKVVYVWFDAVLGYISAAKEWAAGRGSKDDWKRFWQDEKTKYVAFIGKDNVVFHCIVFPAMLMAWNDGGGERYVLPENVPANEFLNLEGQKFSKSKGWGIDVRDFLDRFPADTLRYALATSLPESRDSDFMLKDFQARVNNELADILGNFVNRTVAFAHREFGGTVPEPGRNAPADKEFLARVAAAPGAVAELYERYRFRDGVAEAMNLARAANKYFNDQEPWKTARSDRDRCATTIHHCLQAVRSLGILFSPVVPDTAQRMLAMLNLPPPGAGEWEAAAKPALSPGHRLAPAEILISKIEDAQIQALLPGQGEPANLQQAESRPSTMITIDDFKKIDLRIARILSAERIPKSSKLLKLKIQVGSEERQIVAGIAKAYEPEKLAGKLVVVVANLQPATLMGEESRGMLLAAHDEEGHLSILTVDDELPPGSAVR